MKEESTNSSRWRFIIYLLVGLFALSYIGAGILSTGIETGQLSGNVAVIQIYGTIGSGDSWLEQTVNPADTILLIERAAKSPQIKAIVLDINSGGGAPVASESIVNAVKALNKTAVAVISDVGASGAYWIASACNLIVASKYSVVGSIGAFGSYIDYSGLLARYNITYQRFVGGELKDIGVPYREPTARERAILQARVDVLQAQFMEEIRLNRNLSDWQVAELSSALFYTGEDTKRLGLVDEFGGMGEAKAYLKKQLNTTSIQMVTLTNKKSLIESLTQLSSDWAFHFGRGVGTALANLKASPKISFGS